MSTILDALRKLQREREKKEAAHDLQRDVTFQEPGYRAPPRRRRASPLPLLLTVLLLAAGAGGAWWWFLGSAPPGQRRAEAPPGAEGSAAAATRRAEAQAEEELIQRRWDDELRRAGLPTSKEMEAMSPEEQRKLRRSSEQIEAAYQRALAAVQGPRPDASPPGREPPASALAKTRTRPAPVGRQQPASPPAAQPQPSPAPSQTQRAGPQGQPPLPARTAVAPRPTQQQTDRRSLVEIEKARRQRQLAEAKSADQERRQKLSERKPPPGEESDRAAEPPAPTPTVRASERAAKPVTKAVPEPKPTATATREPTPPRAAKPAEVTPVEKPAGAAVVAKGETANPSEAPAEEPEPESRVALTPVEVDFPDFRIESVRWHPSAERRTARVHLESAGPLEVQEGDIVAGALIRRIDPSSIEIQVGSARKRVDFEE